jgi:hypothetical protein
LKCVHTTPDRTIAQLLRGALESEGVPTIVQGEHLSALQGEIPVGAAAEYRVCIVDDEQLPRATQLATRWLADEAGTNASAWVCKGCGERHEPQFHSCWRCGGETEAP